MATSEVTQRNEKARKNIEERLDAIGQYDDLYLHSIFDEGKDIEDIIRMSHLTKTKVVMPSISNATKEVKDLLDKDPYNLPLIKMVGFKYAAEYQWDKCANVMMRAWKRVGEFKEPVERFRFLMKLSEASYRNFQHKQAYAVLMDVEEPSDPVERKAFQLLTCHIMAQQNDAPAALKAFSKAIEKDEFEAAIKFYAATAVGLKKVGAFEAAKNAVVNKVRSGPNYHMDESRCKTVESWAMMSSDTAKDEKPSFTLWDSENKMPSKQAIYMVCALSAFLFLVLMYYAEQSSLKKKNITL